MRKILVLFALCFVLPSMAMKKQYSEKQQKANLQLFRAIVYGNLKEVQKAIDEGADINFYHSCYGLTPLHMALTQKNIKNTELAKFLIKAGANVNEVSEEGTPLELAIREENKAIFEILLDAEDIDLKNELGEKALEEAFDTGLRLRFFAGGTDETDEFFSYLKSLLENSKLPFKIKTKFAIELRQTEFWEGLPQEIQNILTKYLGIPQKEKLLEKQKEKKFIDVIFKFQ